MHGYVTCLWQTGSARRLTAICSRSWPIVSESNGEKRLIAPIPLLHQNPNATAPISMRRTCPV